MQDIRDYIDQNKQRFLDELFDFLRIPSISAQPDHKDDVAAAANWLKEKFEALNVDKVEVYPTPGNPIVYAEKFVGEGLPTVLMYGHYDVQPPDPMDLWESGPFEPVIKNEKIYARGSCDDKGQLYMHLKALEVMNELGAHNCNMKFIIEGEEEVGSVNLEGFTQEYKDLLACDIVLVSDTSIIANDIPSITVGLRGLAYLEVEITGPNRDLHSGTYGGAIGNPINILSKMVASLHDENNHITIPGFYDDVIELSDEERAKMAERPFDKAKYCADLEIANTQGEAGYTEIEWISIRPTLDLNGIWGGYTGDGAKTVLPSKAHAKVSMRLVPNQDPEKIAKMFEEHFLSIAPESVKVKVTNLHGGKGAVVPIDSIAYKAAEVAMNETFGKGPIPTREGGSIPIVAMFKEVLGADTILMGFGLNEDAIHSPNESYGVFNFLKGIETIPRFYHHYAELSKVPAT